MNFKQKYFKYKNKYLKLKNQENNFNLEGGSDPANFAAGGGSAVSSNSSQKILTFAEFYGHDHLFFLVASWVDGIDRVDDEGNIRDKNNNIIDFNEKQKEILYAPYLPATETTLLKQHIHLITLLANMETKFHDYIKLYSDKKEEANLNYYNFINYKSDYERFDYYNKTALSFAIELGKIDLAEQLIRLGADIHLALELLNKENNNTYLHYIVENLHETQQLNVVDFVLRHATREYITKINNSGETALAIAIRKNQVVLNTVILGPNTKYEIYRDVILMFNMYGYSHNFKLP
jgi:hypothetical protein